jgi:hypothetical protein
MAVKKVIHEDSWYDNETRRHVMEIEYSDGTKATRTISDRQVQAYAAKGFRANTSSWDDRYRSPYEIPKMLLDPDERPEEMFTGAWRNSQMKKFADERGIAIGENTPFAYCCFEFRQLEVGNVVKRRHIKSLSQALEYNTQRERRLHSLKTILDAHAVDHCLYKLEGRNGLYRAVPFETFAKWNQPNWVIAIHVKERKLAAFEPLWDKLSNAILDALEEAVDA